MIKIHLSDSPRRCQPIEICKTIIYARSFGPEAADNAVNSDSRHQDKKEKLRLIQEKKAQKARENEEANAAAARNWRLSYSNSCD